MKVFRDYAEVNEKLLERFTVVEVLTGINADDSGMMIGLERTIDNVTIGVDVVYNPSFEDGESPFMISEEYVKHIIPIPEETEKKVGQKRSGLENNNDWPLNNGGGENNASTKRYNYA